jgi:predicted DNA-binding transcriptional regulator AlpA
MQPILFRKFWIAIASLLSLGTVGLAIFALSNEWLWRWQFRAQLPVPAEATAVKVSYPSNEVQRVIQFDIAPEAAPRVQQFYRTELPKDNWLYRCTVDQPLDVGIELVDVYERSVTQTAQRETLYIGFRKHHPLGQQDTEASDDKQVIQIDEWLTSLPPYKGCS